MSGFEIIGNEVWKAGRIIEKAPTRKAALDRAHELVLAESKGERMPQPAGVKVLSAMVWKDTLTVRRSGSWVGSWNDGAAVMTHEQTGVFANLTRAEMELRFQPAAGGDFEPGVGGGTVVERKTFEALRTDGPLVDQSGVTYSGPGVRYVVRDPGTGLEEVHAEDAFGELFEVVEAPKPLKVTKAPTTAPKNEEA